MPEVWRYDGERVMIHRLHGGRYTVTDTSAGLLPVTAQQLTVWMLQQRDRPYPVWFRAIQEQVRSGERTI